jgi:hypothetical protein
LLLPLLGFTVVQAMIGLSTGIKLGESQVLFAADMTASAFMRTDYNLVTWMADVAGFHKAAGAGEQLHRLPHSSTVSQVHQMCLCSAVYQSISSACGLPFTAYTSMVRSAVPHHVLKHMLINCLWRPYHTH